MKKFVSMVCILSILSCTLFTTASATDIHTSKNDVIFTSFSVLGEEIMAEYHMDGNKIVYAKTTSGTDVAERIDNVIYLNGEKVATILVSDETAIQPRTGWISQEDCLYGTTPSDYTKFISSRDVDVNLEKGILDFSLTAFSLIISVLVPPAGAAASIASYIISTAAGGQYAYAKTLYFHETIYGHKTLPNMWRQVQCTYYFDKNHNDYAASGTYYMAWG